MDSIRAAQPELGAGSAVDGVCFCGVPDAGAGGGVVDCSAVFGVSVEETEADDGEPAPLMDESFSVVVAGGTLDVRDAPAMAAGDAASTH
jgi:hypothetical protein